MALDLALADGPLLCTAPRNPVKRSKLAQQVLPVNVFTFICKLIFFLRSIPEHFLTASDTSRRNHSRLPPAMAPLLLSLCTLLGWSLVVCAHMPDVAAPDQLPPAACPYGCEDWATAVKGDGELAAMFHDASAAAAGQYGNSCMQLGNSIPNTDCIECPGRVPHLTPPFPPVCTPMLRAPGN